ncbi:MAG: c-type cytochrome [Acidobacteriota bacterium]|nr:c-type cytochrome [Acidobacteriota bacterium]
MSWPSTVPCLAVASVIAVAGCASSGGPVAEAPTAATEREPVVAAEAPAPAETTPASAYLADEAALKRASQLFRAVCTGYCHTTEGAGREAPDLFDCESMHGGSDQEVFTVITGGLPNTQMQAFGGKLPDEDLWRIVAYLRANSTCS